jgi:MFS family permease
VTRLRLAGRQTFRSLSTRNFRIYIAGQIVSGSGSWMQQIAQAWLVLKLTDSGLALGIVTALQFLPVLLGGAWAGVIADRMDKRKLLIATSAVAVVLALTLGLLTAFDVVELWMVYVLAMLLGGVTALDSPARRSFVTELVPEEHEANAVSLNSSVFTAARIVGPALAGIVIAVFGIPVCFFLNSFSFVAVIVAMLMLDTREIRPARPVARERGQLVAGLRYVWSIPALRTTLLMTAIIGTLSFNFQVTLSLMAKKVFGGDAGTFGALYALMSVGALVGSLVVAHREKATSRFVVVAALLFGGLMLVAAAAPTIEVMAVVLLFMGGASIAFLSSAGALSQTRADPQYRGRVAALFAVAFLGSTPIGGPIVGAISQWFGARAGLVLGGVTAVVTGLWALAALRRRIAAGQATGQVPVVAA